MSSTKRLPPERWDALIDVHGPHPEILANAAGVSVATARKALNRRGYYLEPGRPQGKVTTSVTVTLPERQVEAAGGLARFRDAVRQWAARKFGR